MSREFADLFAEQDSNVIEWHGGPVFGLYDFPRIPDHVTIRFIAAKRSPVQGLNLRIRGGTLVVNGVKGRDFVIWHDTAPQRVEVEVRRKPRGEVSLKVWNVWRTGSVTHAWMRNAAMRVDDDPSARRIILRCSDGEGPPSFDDLEIQLDYS